MTDIQPCPKCKKKEGFDWVWSHFGKDTGGHSVCKACKKAFY